MGAKNKRVVVIGREKRVVLTAESVTCTCRVKKKKYYTTRCGLSGRSLTAVIFATRYMQANTNKLHLQPNAA
jgi:hypothetical protein